MDENYLDTLLNKVSSEGKNDLEDNIDLDSGVDIDLTDVNDIPLDEMDDLDDLNLDDLELDDIDFDDVDVMNLEKKLQEEKTDEQFDFDALLDDETYDEEEVLPTDAVDASDENVFKEAETIFTEDINEPEVFSEQKTEAEDKTDGESMLVDQAELDALFEKADTSEIESLFEDTVNTNDKNQSTGVDGLDIDDLFSALGIEDEAEKSMEKTENEELSLDDLLAEASKEFDFEGTDITEKVIEEDEKKGKKSKKIKAEDGEKKKKTISEILFGEMDEDDIEEERILAKKKEEKQKRKEEKKAANEEKKAAKASALEQKKAGDEKKKKEKSEKKAAKEEELREELEAYKDAKKVPTIVVIIVFLAFALFGTGVVYGTKEFNYSQVIKKAADYFDRQRYRLAYDEVSGVEVKKKDEELRDRIYTVMYVERLYESYQNNMELHRPDKALDSLLRGIEKYDEHYEEAVELKIVEDIDGCREKIINELATVYNISEEKAYEIIQTDGQEYTKLLNKYSEGIVTGD